MHSENYILELYKAAKEERVLVLMSQEGVISDHIEGEYDFSSESENSSSQNLLSG